LVKTEMSQRRTSLSDTLFLGQEGETEDFEDGCHKVLSWGCRNGYLDKGKSPKIHLAIIWLSLNENSEAKKIDACPCKYPTYFFAIIKLI
jgi:hypothetical protein